VGGDMVAGCIDHRAAPEQSASSSEPSAASSGVALVSTAALSCVPPEDDPRLRDGAILDSATGDWTRIADAPAPLSDISSGVVIGDLVYFWSWPSFATNGPTEGTWMSYDASDDAWKVLAPPPGLPPGDTVRAGDRVIAVHGSEERGAASDQLYDPAADSWTELPRDPLSPSFDRSMVWTGREVVLLGHELAPNPGSDRPSLVRAATFDPETEVWRRLPDSEILGGFEYWEWSGGRVVNAVPPTSDGGQVNNYGRHYPHGGMLDPATGEWFGLPEGVPANGGCADDGTGFDSHPGPFAAGPNIVVNKGLALHVSQARWEAVPCNAPRANAKFASTWAFDGLVTFGGYESRGAPPGQSTTYEFSNAAWMWRPAA